jgi:hypothetical protein
MVDDSLGLFHCFFCTIKLLFVYYFDFCSKARGYNRENDILGLAQLTLNNTLQLIYISENTNRINPSNYIY